MSEEQTAADKIATDEAAVVATQVDADEETKVVADEAATDAVTEDAPVAAEAAEEAEADEVATEGAPKDLDKGVWGDTGNDIGNSVLGMLQESGISTADAKALMFDAVQAGDVARASQDEGRQDYTRISDRGG